MHLPRLNMALPMTLDFLAARLGRDAEAEAEAEAEMNVIEKDR
jgi:acetolactate decarboxylase